MIKTTVYQDVQGSCPKCSGSLTYFASEHQDECLYYPWQCDECGIKGKEIYDLTFATHIDTDGTPFIERNTK